MRCTEDECRFGIIKVTQDILTWDEEETRKVKVSSGWVVSEALEGC